MRWETQQPWVLRVCPKNGSKRIGMLFMWLGAVAYVIFVVAGLWGIIFAPLAVASQHSGSLLSAWMRSYVQWLAAHFSRDAFMPIYVLIQLGIAAALLYAIRVFVWLRGKSSIVHST